MATELEKIIGGESEPVAPLEPEVPKEPTVPEENPELKALREEKENLEKAVLSEQDRLKKIRQDIKKAKTGVEDEEELPQIDLKDPSAKAWDKRIQESAAPAQLELEKAKDERRLYALKQFLSDKPSLSKNPEKLKEMMETYDRLKTSTELTGEGITMDLEKAYAATHAEELIQAARNSRIDNAKKETLFSDIAVSRGSTAYSEDPETPIAYDDEQKAILAKWNMTPSEHAEMVKEMRKKAKVG